VRLQVEATVAAAAPIGGDIKVMIRANNQPAGDTPAAISSGAGLVALNGYDGAATTRRHLLTLPGTVYGRTPGGISEGVVDVLRAADGIRWDVLREDEIRMGGGIRMDSGNLSAGVASVPTSAVVVMGGRRWLGECAVPDGGAGGVLGDINGDCEFNVKDVLEAQKYIAKLSGYDTADLDALDAFTRRQLDPTLDYLKVGRGMSLE